MAGADLGILAAGTLLYEAAAAGLPALFLSLSDAQRGEAAALADALRDRRRLVGT